MLEFLSRTLEVHHTDLVDMQLHTRNLEKFLLLFYKLPNSVSHVILGHADVKALKLSVKGSACPCILLIVFTTIEKRNYFLYLLDPWDSSNYRGMCTQDNVAEFAGTMDSIVAAAEEQQSQSLVSETDWPEMTLQRLNILNLKKGKSSNRDRNYNATKTYKKYL